MKQVTICYQKQLKRQAVQNGVNDGGKRVRQFLPTVVNSDKTQDQRNILFRIYEYVRD